MAKQPAPASAKNNTAKAKRFRPEPWTEDDARTLALALASSGRAGVPASRKKAFVGHASAVLEAQIKVRRGSASPFTHRRNLADVATMRRACDRLRGCWEGTQAKEWIWLACKPPFAIPPAKVAQVRRHIKKHTINGWIHYDLERHAVVPADREECLLSMPDFFVHDLRRLDLALRRAEELLHGVRPRKAEIVGGLLGELYDAYRRDTGLKPSIHGPFGTVAKFAVKRVFGEPLGTVLLADRLKVLHAVATFTRWDMDPDEAASGGFLIPADAKGLKP